MTNAKFLNRSEVFKRLKKPEKNSIKLFSKAHIRKMKITKDAYKCNYEIF